MKGLFLDAVWSSPSLARISLPVIEPLLYSNVREFSSCPDSSKETQINLSMARFCSCPVCTSNHWSDFLVGPVTHFFRIDTINPTIASKLNRKCVPMFRSPIQPQFFFLFSFFFFDEQGTRYEQVFHAISKNSAVDCNWEIELFTDPIGLLLPPGECLILFVLKWNQ